MIDRGVLLKDLQRQVKALETDLREQVDALGEVHTRLRAEYDRAFRVKRTAATWPVWRDERVTQVAAAWVLGTVFVRFCEDNGLLTEPYLAGPDADRMTLAEERHDQFFVDDPSESDRGWLLAAFGAIAAVPAGAFLFDRRHNPLFQVPLSHDAAKALVAFWRRRGEDGKLVHDFTDPETGDNPGWDTRFLGDLYQDLSEAARKRYALLQTPEFVEEFILDLTLTPAIDEFGHDVVRMIDPACGSGHFLLGTFHRLLKVWEDEAPRLDARERVRLALNAVHGVDVNPFAVAIARFRLLLAALKAGGFTTWAEAAASSFPIHVAVGDSLREYERPALLDVGGSGDDGWKPTFAYETEDAHEYLGLLKPKSYHVVVGNPPYITEKDKEASRYYRKHYKACSGTYALSVPFAQRFFGLARGIGPDGRGAGYVGQITANSFMKREFGRKLITWFFAGRVELTHVIDTSGAYIPGHGTPTVILIGRHNWMARQHSTVRTVLGIRGEPGAPEVPSEGKVWRAIVEQINNVGSESEWVSVVDLPRNVLAPFPWSLAGGGSSSLREILESCTNHRLARFVESIGIVSFTLQDEIFIIPVSCIRRRGIGRIWWRPVVVGEHLRDWTSSVGDAAIFPYDAECSPVDVEDYPELLRHFWPMRTSLWSGLLFGGKTKLQAGLKWAEFGRLTVSKLKTSLSMSLAFVGTHNHVVLDRGGKVFNRTAPVIKLPEGAGEEEHLRLLGVLNSSTACFWLKQVCHDKGSQGVNEGFKSQPWERFYEFTGTKLQEFPLPAEYPLELATELDGLAQRLTAVSPASVAAEGTPTRERLAAARREWESTRARMIALQEELDWQVYALYGLLDDLRAPAASVPELNLGERAFEIVLARRMAAGEVTTEWFTRHGSTPITEIPVHWPADYRAAVERRIAVIESNRNIGLIERPECKRRWATEGFDAMEARALRDWLLDRCETRELWFHEIDGMEQPRPLTTAQLADALRRDTDVVAVAELYTPGRDLADVVADLVADEHVPYLAALRYTPTGLAKRADWEAVWEQQRAEDAASTEEEKRKIRDAIPVPPKYGQPDFVKASYWRQRGKLDVPKERFVSYPHASLDGDPSLLLGWAGWDHREQAQALAMLVVAGEQDGGWGADRLAPLLAGLRELLPWVCQWHGEFDPAYQDSPAEVYAAFLADCTNRFRLTDEALTSWRPPAPTRARRRKP